MVAIRSARLTIGRTDPANPGRRRVQIDYDLEVAEDDPALGEELTERISLRPVDRHDAPVAPSMYSVFSETDRFVVSPGVAHRSLVRDVVRADLDVEADWWATSNEGEPIPIAEWLDHVAGCIELLADGSAVVRMATPVVTGSWGALGSD